MFTSLEEILIVWEIANIATCEITFTAWPVRQNYWNHRLSQRLLCVSLGDYRVPLLSPPRYMRRRDLPQPNVWKRRRPLTILSKSHGYGTPTQCVPGDISLLQFLQKGRVEVEAQKVMSQKHWMPQENFQQIRATSRDSDEVAFRVGEEEARKRWCYKPTAIRNVNVHNLQVFGSYLDKGCYPQLSSRRSDKVQG